MKHLSFFLIISYTFVLGQNENSTHCSKRDRAKHLTLKSNSLNLAQIAQSEKYDVNYYKLNLNMTNTSTTLSGYAEMKATAISAIDTVLYELFSSLSISSVSLNGTNVPFTRAGSAVKIAANLSPGSSFIIRTNYSGTPPTAQTNPLGGSGMSNATSPSWGNEVVWSLSEPFCAYEWWPCKQSLTDKADSCDVFITVPNSCKAGSNGVLTQVVNLGNGSSRYEWKHRHPIDYYLISVAVAEYVEYNVFANPVGAPAPILIQNYIYNNPQTLPNFQADIDESVDFIELFYDLYGPYPFEDEKYGHCMAPFSGGMEHQTMTTQGFFNPALTAHELGPQWFGDDITCSYWREIWLNEGFASYSEYLYREQVQNGNARGWMDATHTNVMSSAGGSVYVPDTTDVNRIFSGRLTYDKGAAILHTMRSIANNDSVFFSGLRLYLQTYGGSTASVAQFKALMENHTGVNFSDFFQEWYYGEGFPTFSVEYLHLNDTLWLSVSQTTSVPTSVPFFNVPLELRVQRPNGDTVVRMNLTQPVSTAIVPCSGSLTGLVIDPNQWLLNQDGSITMNGNLHLTSVGNSIQPYPNPSSEKVWLTGLAGNTPFKIINVAGREVMSGIWNPSEGKSIETLNPGVYALWLEDIGRPVRVIKRH